MFSHVQKSQKLEAFAIFILIYFYVQELVLFW